LPASEQTKRLLIVIANPLIHIIGHPTGRLISKRAAITVDWKAIFEACIHHRVALEVNASPDRLDLPDSLVRQAIAKGVWLAFGSDAHQAHDLTQIPYAVDTARRGWAEAKHVLNSLGYAKLKAWLATKNPSSL
jgi:DNA polymerase (family X)